MRNPIVVGERLYLRPLEKEDAAVYAHGAMVEPDAYMDRLRIPHSQISYEQWIEKIHKQQPPDETAFAVCLKEDDQVIGTVTIVDIDYVHRNGETGSWIDLDDFRGQGYGTEAKMLLLEYAFDRLHLHALKSYVWEPNSRSAAALRKQGYQQAGRYRFDDFMDGVYRDGLIFDVLRDDWLEAKEKLAMREQKK